MREFLSKKITRTSFICTVLIVIFHSLNLYTYDISPNSFLYAFESLIAVICDVAVPIFFIVSGYLFFNKVNSVFDVFKSMKKKVFTLLIPFLIFNALYTAYFMFCYNVPAIAKILSYDHSYGAITLKNLVLGLFLSKYSGILWYVRNLLIYTAISPLLYYLVKNKYVRFACLAILFVPYVFSVTVLKEYIRVDYLFFFFLGITVAKTPEIKTDGYKKYYYLIAFAVFCVCTLIQKRLTTYSWGYQILRAFAVACFWVFADSFVTKNTYKIEKITFFIYCLHSMILETVQKCFSHFLGKKVIIAVLDLFISPTFTILFIFGLALIINKFLPKLFKLLSGGRTLDKKYDLSAENKQTNDEILENTTQDETLST